MLNAMLRLAEETDKKIDELNEQGDMYPDESIVYPITPEYYANRIAGEGEMNVLVEERDFRLAMDNLVPSVSEGELARYERQRVMFEGDGKKEKGPGPEK
jgi:peroxin-6